MPGCYAWKSQPVLAFLVGCPQWLSLKVDLTLGKIPGHHGCGGCSILAASPHGPLSPADAREMNILAACLDTCLSPPDCSMAVGHRRTTSQLILGREERLPLLASEDQELFSETTLQPWAPEPSSRPQPSLTEAGSQHDVPSLARAWELWTPGPW